MTKERAKIKAQKYLEWADLADKKCKESEDNWYSTYRDFDWTEPVKIGHHSQRRHEKMFERRDNFYRRQFESEEKVKRFRDRADNLLRFANRNKGDAEKRREAERVELDKIIQVGSLVSCFLINGKIGKVVKVFKKSYRVDYGDIGTRTLQKNFCSPV